MILNKQEKLNINIYQQVFKIINFIFFQVNKFTILIYNNVEFIT